MILWGYRLTKTRSCLNHEELDIGNFERVHQHIQLGAHSGNRFKILLRSVRPKGECDGIEDVVDSSLQSVRRCGFINYFGVQRFNRSLSMPRIGLALLQDNIVSSPPLPSPTTCPSHYLPLPLHAPPLR